MTTEERDVFDSTQDLTTEDILEPQQLLKLEEYEKLLKAYSNETNRLKKDALLKKITDDVRGYLGYTQADVITHATLLSLPETDDERKVYDLQSLLKLQTSIPNWLVPNLIAGGGGLYMVAGSPKAGKTRIFSYQLAFSVMFTGEFLGFPCGQGPVLIFQCEESPAKVARTFRSKGLSTFNDQISDALSADKNLLRIETDFAVDTDVQSGYLKKVVKEFKPALVIYDSLRAITKHTGVSENSSDISKYLYMLQKVHNYLEVPGLIIHHMSKGGKERGLEGVAGSLSLAGATDGVFRLYRDEAKGQNGQNTHSVELITDPREGLPIHWKIQLTKPKDSYWSYKITEDMAVNPEQHRLERRILRWMSKFPNQLFSRSEVAQALEVDRSKVPLDFALDRLIDSLQIAEEQTDHGFKIWITDSSPWASITGDTLSDDFEIADRLATFSTKSEFSSFVKDWTQPYKERIYRLLSPSEQIKVTELLHESKFSVGDWVEVEEDGEVVKHKIEHKKFMPKEKIWLYTLEDKREFKEEDLTISLDYADADYSEGF